MIAYGYGNGDGACSTCSYDNYCPSCGRCCSCTASRVFTFRPSAPGSNVYYYLDREAAERARREQEMEEALRRYAAWRASVELGCDYSLRPVRPPRPRNWVPSVSFHWMSQRKRAFKLRPSKPGWDRGR